MNKGGENHLFLKDSEDVARKDNIYDIPSERHYCVCQERFPPQNVCSVSVGIQIGIKTMLSS